MKINGQLRSDPTRTLTLRRRFVADMDRRFNQLKREIEMAVVELDVFGLNPRSHSLNVLFNPYHDSLGRFASAPGTAEIQDALAKLEQVESTTMMGSPSPTGKYMHCPFPEVPDNVIHELETLIPPYFDFESLPMSAVSMRAVETVQPTIKKEKVAYFIRGGDQDSDVVTRNTDVRVIRYQGHTILWDGNHRVVALSMFGDTQFNARVLDIATNNLRTNLEPRQFEFTRSDQKINMFMQWLKEMERKHILTVTSRADTRVGEAPWTNLYIQSAYQRGLARARAELRRKRYDVPSATGVDFTGRNPIAVAFNQPFHADRVAMIYTRSYNELKGVTNAMDQQISRVLAQGLAEGLSPYDMARTLTNRVDAIGKNRGRTLARTEVVYAHHQATINEYEQWGATGVTVQAEWLTAGFGVCPICAPREGKIYSLEQVRGMIPVHPNCRCCAIPVVKGS